MLRSGHIIQLCVVALLGVGVLMVHSAGMDARQLQDGSSAATFSWLFEGRSTFYALLAVAAMIFGSRINIRQTMHSRSWANPLAWLMALTVALLVMTFVPSLNRSVNGASRWISFGPSSWHLSFQPSELAKWVLIIAIAWWCTRKRGIMHKFFQGLLPALILIGIVCLLIMVEDLGTAVLVGAVAVCMLIAGGARVWQLAMLIPAGAAAIIAAIIQSPYRLTRLTAFLNPWVDPSGAGYHPIQSMLAFAQGGLLGSGLGNSIQKYYLPESTSDFIFPVICEELGLIGAITIIGLYLVIIWVGLGIIRDCKDTFGRLVGLGILLTVGFQVVINVAVVTVVVPTKGIALPLISSGGTGWVLTAFSLGLIAGLDTANYYESDEADEQKIQPELNLSDNLAD